MKSWKLLIAAMIAGGLALPALAGPKQQAILKKYQVEAAAAAGFAGFSADRGKAFFGAKHTGGKPGIASCTSCHTASPLKSGKTNAGKTIEPMAVSASPGRYTDFEKTEKWFGRNCSTVLGRPCTAQEKGDFIAYMSSL